MQTIQARQYHRGRRNRIKRIYIHSMESPEGPNTAENLGRYFATLTSRKASAHIGCDNNSAVRYVHDKDTAFHVGNDNSSSLGLELAGRARQTREEWLDPYGLAMLRIAAYHVANWCSEYDIPAIWLDIVDLKEDQKGISSHANGAKAFGGSTHWDPGPSFPHDVFIELVRGFLEGDELTPEEKQQLDRIELKLTDIQNFINGDQRVRDHIVDPINEEAGRLRDSVASLIRRIAGVFGIMDDGTKATYDKTLDQTK